MHESMLGMFDKNSDPITIEEWGRLQEDDAYFRIGSTYVGEWWISTVWIGINMNYARKGPPILFESMVFWTGTQGDKRRVSTEYTGRYATVREAELGHAQIVSLVAAAEGLEAVDADEEHD